MIFIKVMINHIPLMRYYWGTNFRRHKKTSILCQPLSGTLILEQWPRCDASQTWSVSTFE